VLKGKFSKAGEKKFNSAAADILTLPLGTIKGLSKPGSKGSGTINLDLSNGTYVLSLSALEPGNYEVDLLQNSPNGSSLGPDAQDWIVPLTVVTIGQNPVDPNDELGVNSQLEKAVADAKQAAADTAESAEKAITLSREEAVRRQLNLVHGRSHRQLKWVQ
jgi:hypothetical protein